MSNELLYQPTDIVLAKVKGFSAWPAMIIPDEIIPDSVLKNKAKLSSSSSKNSNDDQEDEEQEEDSGDEDFIIYSNVLKFRKYKNLKKVYCVKFLCDDNYIWVKPSDIHLLTSKECEDWLKTESTKRRINKKLIPAYEMASKGSENIDVWEFVEYGSYGKLDEEEYIEEDEEEYEDEVSTSRRSKKTKENVPSRSSARVSAKRKQEELQEVKPKRNTRSNKPKIPEKMKEEDFIKEEPPTRTNKKQKKTTTKTKTKAKEPVIEMYNYESDEDWAIIGLGPQDLLLGQHANKLVNKLSQKKNLEIHKEKCLDINDKLSTINKLILDLLIPDPNNENKGSSKIKQDYEVVIDELQLALQYNNRNDEFISIFQTNNELLLNLRILLNLQFDQLKKWDLLEDFNSIFEVIYKTKFTPDSESWRLQFETTQSEEATSENIVETNPDTTMKSPQQTVET